jgi:hypothetical protein
MKRTAVTLALLFWFGRCLGQSQSELYAHVDSLIVYDLKFKQDTVQQNVLPDRTIIRSQRKLGLDPSVNTILIANEPIIVFNGITVDKQILNSFNLKDTRRISVLHADASTSAIYGSRSVNGVIVIEGANRKVDNRLKRIHNGL